MFCAVHKVLVRPITYQNIKKQARFLFSRTFKSNRKYESKHSVKQIQSLACVTQGPGLGWGGRGEPWCLSGKGDVECSVMIMVAGFGGPRQAGPVGRGRYGVVGPAGLCLLPTPVSTQTPRGRALPLPSACPHLPVASAFLIPGLGSWTRFVQPLSRVWFS